MVWGAAGMAFGPHERKWSSRAVSWYAFGHACGPLSDNTGTVYISRTDTHHTTASMTHHVFMFLVDYTSQFHSAIQLVPQLKVI